MSTGPQSQATEKPPVVKSASPLKEAPREIKSIADEVSSEEIEAYKEVTQAQDRRYKLEKILGVWEDLQQSERILRRNSAYVIFGALFIELILGNWAFFELGFGQKTILDPWIVKTFFIGMYTQIISIAMFVVKYLFPAPKQDAGSQLNDMITKL